MKVEFQKTEYVAAHGKAPRGKGRWAFQVVQGGIPEHMSMDYWEAKTGTPYFFGGSLVEAKAQASKEFRKLFPGCTYVVVEVLP